MSTCPICNSSKADTLGACEACTTSGLGGLAIEVEAEAGRQPIGGDATVFAEVDASATSRGPASTLLRALEPGDILGERYEIVSLLGQGGMGSVYKAIDQELDRTVALKTIRADLVANQLALRRFKQELLLTRQIAHYNVIRIFDISVAQGQRFISMEYIDGEDLCSFLKRKRVLDPTDAAAIVEQICRGLGAAHAEDVVHRDLKPQNVLMDMRGRVCITDFGLARSFDDAGTTKSGAVLGTPRYMAPEQCRGEQADRRSDLYALGLMLYEMLSGQVPFADGDALSLFTRRARDRVPAIETLVPQCPPHLARVVTRCLELDRPRRYQTADEILHDLERAPASHSVQTDVREPRNNALQASDLRPGTTLGHRYRIEAEAGQGGMGRVYKACDLELSRTVALKVIRPELAGDAETLERLRHEVTLASRISHPSVVRTHDLGECDGLRFISMAWLEGETLDHLIRRAGALDEAAIFRIAEQICGGLAAAHEEGIVHRDLKPSNIMMDAEQRPYLMDFGLAESPLTQSVSSLSATSSSLSSSGTPRYMSPEQVSGGTVDSRSDLYSLGLILYEMGTGVPAFRGDTSFQTMMQRISEPPRYPRLLNPALSPELADIIMRLLEREPDTRFATATALLQALHEPAKNATTKGRKVRPWHIAALTAMVVTAVLAGFLIFGRKAGQAPDASTSDEKLVVVLFHPIGSDPKVAYASEGINEAIASSLFPLKSVHLTSSAGLDPADMKLSERDLAIKLGANTLVEGVVQGQGDALSVIAYIVDRKTARRTWSSTFPGSQMGLLSLENEICQAVVSQLDAHETADEKQRASTPPTHDIEAYDLYLKGRSLYKNSPTNPESTEEALGLFEQARKKDPTFALAWTGVADASLRLYRLKKDTFMADKALDAAENAKNQNGKLPEVHFALGSVLASTGQNPEAIQEFQQALLLAPNSDDGYLRLGRAFLDSGHKLEGIAAMEKAVALNRYYFNNYTQLGRAYFEIGNNDKALENFQMVKTLQPANPTGYTNTAAVYLREGRWQDAIPALNKALQLKKTASAYLNLGTAHYYLGRFKDAVAMDELAVKKNPNDRLAVGNLADAYKQNRQHDKADATYRHAIELAYKQLQVNPKDINALGGLSLYYARVGNSTEALKNIAHARSLDPGDSSLMYYEAIVDALAHNQSESLAALKRALEHGFSEAQARAEPDLREVYAAARRR